MVKKIYVTILLAFFSAYIFAEKTPFSSIYNTTDTQDSTWSQYEELEEDADLADEEFITNLINKYTPGYEERVLGIKREVLQAFLKNAFLLSYELHSLDIEVKKDEPLQISPSLIEEEDVVQSVYKNNELTPKSDISFTMNKRIEAFIKLYTGKKRKVFERGLERATVYYSMVQRILSEHELPHDLFYLAMVESNFNYKAVSRANAVGLWQFIRSTGIRYDLDINWWADERLDAEKSTRAAAMLLKDLYKQFGNWNAALAAYNSGAGKVSRAIKRNRRLGKPTDYWNLRLPRETRGYVPAFYAVITIFKDLPTYGFKVPHSIKKETTYASFEIPRAVSFHQLSKKLGIPVTTLKTFNPALKYSTTPAHVKYIMKFPPDFVINQEKIQTLKAEKTSQLAYYRVRRGDSIWLISRKYNTSMRSIFLHNPQIQNQKYLKIGQKIAIPSPATRKNIQKSSYSQKKQLLVLNDEQAYYTVSYGDSFWSIAKKYHISFQDLLALNPHVSNKRYLSIGQKIVIPVKTRKNTQKEKATVHPFYQIRRGDSLWSIAKNYNLSIQEIIEYNPQIVDQRFLKVGEKIVLPSNRSTNILFQKNTQRKNVSSNIKYAIHHVRKGETLWEISRMYGVSINSIVSNNSQIRSARYIKTGTKLKIDL